MTGRGHRDIPADQIDWRDGTEPGIRYARFPLDDADAASPSVILSRFSPGVEVPAHTHDTNYFEYIIEGEQSVGKTMFRAGDVRLVSAGTGYGPIKVGPEGCTVMIVFQNGSQSMTVPMPRKKVGVGVGSVWGLSVRPAHQPVPVDRGTS